MQAVFSRSSLSWEVQLDLRCSRSPSLRLFLHMLHSKDDTFHQHNLTSPQCFKGLFEGQDGVYRFELEVGLG